MNLRLLLSFLLFYTFFGCASSSGSNDNEIKAEEIIKKIKKGENILYNDVTITGDLDLTKVVTGFPESKGVIRYIIPSSLSFINCNFKGKIIGFRNDGKFSHVIQCEKNLTCINCEFQEDVVLKESIIEGVVNIGNCKFHKQAILTGAVFNARYNYFNDCLFRDKAFFQGVEFKGTVNFMKAEFVGIGYFQNAEFNGLAQFSNTKFYQNTDFSLVSFYDGCMFNYVQFHGKAIFSSSYINKRGDFIEVKFKGPANFKRAKVDGELKFLKSVFSDGLILNEAKFIFYEPNLEDVVFENESKLEYENTQIIKGEVLNLKLND